jgi:hypothetical protein
MYRTVQCNLLSAIFLTTTASVVDMYFTAEVQGPSAEQSGQTGGYLDGYVSSLQRPRGPYHHPRNPCWTPTELQGMSLGSRYWECKWDDNFV